MPGLQNIDQLRAVGNFATTYLWDIKFLNASIGSSRDLVVGGAAFPYPFNDWFPAASVEEPIYQIETYAIKAHILETEIPKSTGNRQITIECFDDARHTVERELQRWFSLMFPGYREVTPLLDVLKVLEVSRLTPGKKLMYTNRYYVFPKGSLQVGQNSQSAIKKLNFTLAVAGMELKVAGISRTE
jgi:hypothetical protein